MFRENGDADFSHFAGAWHESWRRIAGCTFYSILDLDSIMFQSAARCSIKFNFGLFINRQSGNQV
jgi:hypothetical protein